MRLKPLFFKQRISLRFFFTLKVDKTTNHLLLRSKANQIILLYFKKLKKNINVFYTVIISLGFFNTIYLNTYALKLISKYFECFRIRIEFVFFLLFLAYIKFTKTISSH